MSENKYLLIASLQKYVVVIFRSIPALTPTLSQKARELLVKNSKTYHLILSEYF